MIREHVNTVFAVTQGKSAEQLVSFICEESPGLIIKKSPAGRLMPKMQTKAKSESFFCITKVKELISIALFR